MEDQKRIGEKGRGVGAARLVAALACLIIGLVLYGYFVLLKPAASPTRDVIVPRFSDEAGLFTPAYASAMNELLHYEFNELGVDMRYLVIQSLPRGEKMNAYAVARMRTRGIGASVNERGILCIYDVGTQGLTIEVGPRLEGALPDAFVSYLELENTHAYAGTHDLGLGLKLTAQLIIARLRDAELDMAYDPRPAEYIHNSELLAEGAGATESMKATAPGSGVLNRPAPEAIARDFTPQASVDETWQRYLRWLVLPYEYTNVMMFTEDTQRFLAHEPMSLAYRHFITMMEYGQPYRVYYQGDLAMLVFTDSPFESPYYFRRGQQGWQMDIVGAIRNSENLLGGPYTWVWRNGHDVYAQAFRSDVIVAAQYVTDGGKTISLLRVKGGDNRLLPVYTEKLYSATHPSP